MDEYMCVLWCVQYRWNIESFMLSQNDSRNVVAQHVTTELPGIFYSSLWHFKIPSYFYAHWVASYILQRQQSKHENPTSYALDEVFVWQTETGGFPA